MHQRTHNGHLRPTNIYNLICLHSTLLHPQIPPNPYLAIHTTTPHLMRPRPRGPDIKTKLLLRKRFAPGTIPQRERVIARIVDEERV